ncbi:hypothetical protein GCM10027269_21550 [Kribbella endophytica]
MVEHRLAIANRAALPQLVVELFDRAGSQLRHRDVAELRPGASLEVAPVAVKRRLFEVDQVEVSFYELADGCIRARLSTFIDLRLESTHRLRCLTACFGGAGREGLPKVVPSLGDGSFSAYATSLVSHWAGLPAAPWVRGWQRRQWL